MRAKLEGAAAVTKLLRTLEHFRKIDPEMPLQQIMLLLGAAEAEARPGAHDAASVQDLCTKLDLAQSTASRNLAVLSGKDMRFQERTALLSAYENPMNRRQKLVALTPEGIKLMRQIISTME